MTLTELIFCCCRCCSFLVFFLAVVIVFNALFFFSSRFGSSNANTPFWIPIHIVIPERPTECAVFNVVAGIWKHRSTFRIFDFFSAFPAYAFVLEWFNL